MHDIQVSMHAGTLTYKARLTAHASKQLTDPLCMSASVWPADGVHSMLRSKLENARMQVYYRL